MATNSLPHTYQEVVFVDDLDALAQETQSDLQSLAQDVYHLLLEDLGSNLDDPTRGIGIYNKLGGTLSDLQLLPAEIVTQLNADPAGRINNSTCTLNANADGSYLIAITLEVSAGVVPLQFNWSAANGLQLVSPLT